MKCRHECTNEKLPRMHQKPVAPALNAKPLNHSKPTNKQINASTNQRSSKDRNMSGNRPLCLPITIFPYFLLIESTKDQGMNNGNLPALAKQRKSMQGPVKHNALPSCFSWVWQSNHSSVGSFEALYFTNSAALRAALPCKISSCLPIHPGRTLPVHPTACAPNPVRIWKCFFFERSHRNTSHCSRAGCVSHARTAGSAGVNEKTAENPRSWPQ